jgi:hypothetical protein
VHSLVLKRHGCDLARHGEHDVKVRNGQEVGFPIGHPLLSRRRLTLRTMPVAARVVRHLLVPTSIAAIDVTTEDGSPTGDDVAQDLALHDRDPLTSRCEVLGAVCANDIGDLQSRSP